MSPTCGSCGHTAAVALPTCGRCGALTATVGEAPAAVPLAVQAPVDDRTVSRVHLTAVAAPVADTPEPWALARPVAGPPPAAPPAGSVLRPVPGPASAAPRVDIGARVLAYLVDTVVLVVAFVLPAYVLQFTPLRVLNPLWFLACLAAYIWTTGVSGQTVGKRLMGQQVVDVRTGDVIGVGRSFQRFLLEGLSNIVCYAGMWSAFLDSASGRYQAWHDKAVGTWVVSVPKRGIDSTLWTRRR